MTRMLESEKLPAKIIGRDIFFFDGDCVLCHNLVQLLLRVDENKHFLLCAQQSDIGHLVLERHGINVDDLSTVYIVRNCGRENEDLLVRSKATIYAMSKTKFALYSKLLRLIPPAILDFGYKIVAANRYKMFGKKNSTCLMPTTDDLERIIS